ncbi:protein tweety-2-like isoform X2 [Condylostylus longicornis]|uniref:protein tweety-2-like isoform X2 n=1 Tax=Condylostylus longicornis TaxID=2530218 RepID=UPI00244E263B|nr:protein tweety-2-like isoform X2 [Condylostylus longicornis]
MSSTTMMQLDQPSILSRVLHSIPHVNITFRHVNDTFDPDSDVYLESLGILASIPATLLILALFGLLFYLLTRCCDRKPRKPKTQKCQNCTLFIITLVCCAAVGLGLYGNDDFHNGLLQAFAAGKQVETLVGNLKVQTETIKNDLETKVKKFNLEEMIDKPNYNQTVVTMLLETCRLIRDNASRAVTSLDMVVYFMKNHKAEANALMGPDLSLQNILYKSELFEAIRWPTTLTFLTILLLLCAVLLIAVARRSRCALIFFSVCGLFGIIICWFLAGIYLASSVALGDFCMKPVDHMCRQVGTKNPDDVFYLNCGTLRNRFILRLNESRDFVERSRESVYRVSKMSREVRPTIEIQGSCESMIKALQEIKEKLTTLSASLDHRNIDKHYLNALSGICGNSLLGLSLMMVAGILTAFLLTILVYAASHAWIYLTKKQSDIDKSETAPLFPASPAPTVSSPTAPILGSGTLNRTLLHSASEERQRNGSARTGASSGHHTLGRLPSQTSYLAGPNNGKYATLSKQCKTLEANDFY